MSSLIEILAQQLGSSGTQTIGKQIRRRSTDPYGYRCGGPIANGGPDSECFDPEGARRLHQTVQQDRGGSLLDQLNESIARDQQSTPEDSTDLIKEILGPKQKQVESGVGKMSGLDAGTVAKLMAMLAPVVLGAIGQHQRQEKLDSDGLSKYLGQEREVLHKGDSKQASIFAKMLDQDGDADFDASDMMRLGSTMLGQMFKK